MADKRYVARKVGEQYVVAPASSANRYVDLGWMLGGGALALAGLSRKSVPGLLAALTGGAMICRGVTGRNPIRMLMNLIPSVLRESATEAPSYPHDQAECAGQLPADEVEEASMESFPASDAPARSATAAQ